MDYIQRIVGVARGHAINILNYIRIGVTGAIYGALPQTNATAVDVSHATAVDVSQATATSKVPRFISYDTNPSYRKLYDDDITYDITYDSLERKKVREILNQINNEISQNKNIKDKKILKYLKKIDDEFDDEFDDEDLDKIILTLNTFNKKNTDTNTNTKPFDPTLFKKLLELKKDANLKIKRIRKKEYSKDLDTTQAAFIVFKINPTIYRVFFIYTRDTRIDFLRGKIPTILLRVLYLAQFKFGERIPESYICLGTVDANNNKDQTQTAFHVDGFPRYFISHPLEEEFKNLYTKLFGQNTPPDCGFLDFQTLLNFVAATTGRDKTYELFSLLPGPKGNLAPFFAYLNSLITHATPNFINFDEINAYYEKVGLEVPPGVREFVEKYNDYLEILRENKRKFRRELLSFAPMTPDHLRNTEDTINKFEYNATTVIKDDIIVKNLDNFLLGKSIYDPEIIEEKLFENDQFKNDPKRKNIERFVFMEKTFTETEVSNDNLDNPNLKFLIQLKDQMFVPIGQRVLVGRHEHITTLLGTKEASMSSSELGGKRKSKRNKSRRINTKKKLNKLRKRRLSQRKQNKKRRSKKH